MKKIVVITLSVMFLLLGTTLWADENEHGRSVNVIIDELKQAQGVQTISQIDPSLVSQAQLEELGDAVMGLSIGNDQRHEWMDQMMGGDGSERLASVHRQYAYNYLQSNGNNSSWGGGMGGFGMMRGWGDSSYNNAGYTSRSMMGWSSGWVNGILLILIAAGGTIVIVFLVRSRKDRHDESGNALGILRTRYAEGKITREEYQEMLKDIKK